MSKPQPAELVRSAADGDRVALARAMTMVEQGGSQGIEINRAVDERLAQRDNATVAHVVGITGPPGAGKSTFTDALLDVVYGADAAIDVGVLLVDPSSPRTGGAILGDRVRMADRALTERVFLRSMATRGHSGGLSVAVSYAVRLLDAVGFDLVLIETVGVGQVEVDVAKIADTTVVLLNPGWGDAIQASKAGLMEIADIFVINKSDRAGAAETERDVLAMLQTSNDLRGSESPTWTPIVIRTVATIGEGMSDAYAGIVAHRNHQNERGGLIARRSLRRRDELISGIRTRMDVSLQRFVETPSFVEIQRALMNHEMTMDDAIGFAVKGMGLPST